jgi:hypothetical protein
MRPVLGVTSCSFLYIHRFFSKAQALSLPPLSLSLSVSIIHCVNNKTGSSAVYSWSELSPSAENCLYDKGFITKTLLTPFDGPSYIGTHCHPLLNPSQKNHGHISTPSWEEEIPLPNYCTINRITVIYLVGRKCHCLIPFDRGDVRLISKSYSSVGIALGYGLDDRGLGFDSRRGLGIFVLTTLSRTALGPTQPPIQWVRGALSLGVKRPGHEADHSHPSGAAVKNSWNYTSTPQYVFVAWCLVKHRDNFTFTFM